MRKNKRITNLLAVVHAVAGKQKAKDVGTHFGGSNVHIGHRNAKVTERNCLRGILTDDEIFEVRRKFLELEDNIRYGCVTVPKTYTPGVFKGVMKRDVIVEMYEAGVYTNNEIMREVGCSLQYFQTVLKQIEMRGRVDE